MGSGTQPCLRSSASSSECGGRSGGKPGRSQATATLRLSPSVAWYTEGRSLFPEHLTSRRWASSAFLQVLSGAWRPQIRLTGHWASGILLFPPPQRWDSKHNLSRPAVVYMGSRDQTLVLRPVLQALDWLKCPPSPKILPTPTIPFFTSHSEKSPAQ